MAHGVAELTGAVAIAHQVVVSAVNNVSRGRRACASAAATLVAMWRLGGGTPPQLARAARGDDVIIPTETMTSLRCTLLSVELAMAWNEDQRRARWSQSVDGTPPGSDLSGAHASHR